MRNPPHVWKRFWSLKVGDAFSIGKKGYVKKNLFKARRLSIALTNPVRVSPFRRVRTTQPAKQSPRISDAHDALRMAIAASGCVGRPSQVFVAVSEGASTEEIDEAIAAGKYYPRAKDCLVPNDGKTHYVGDDCPGGHQETATTGCVLRDPMVQDHAPEKQPQYEQQRTL